MLKKQSSGRIFIAKTSTGLLTILASSGSLAAATSSQKREETKNEDGHFFLTKPYLQTPAAESITIMCLTKQLSLNWIEYGESEKLGRIVKQSEKGLLNTNSRINCVPITGLKNAE